MQPIRSKTVQNEKALRISQLICQNGVVTGIFLFRAYKLDLWNDICVMPPMAQECAIEFK